MLTTWLHQIFCPISSRHSNELEEKKLTTLYSQFCSEHQDKSFLCDASQCRGTGQAKHSQAPIHMVRHVHSSPSKPKFWKEKGYEATNPLKIKHLCMIYSLFIKITAQGLASHQETNSVSPSYSNMIHVFSWFRFNSLFFTLFYFHNPLFYSLFLTILDFLSQSEIHLSQQIMEFIIYMTINKMYIIHFFSKLLDISRFHLKYGK